jgi:hypothetical protein
MKNEFDPPDSNRAAKEWHCCVCLGTARETRPHEKDSKNDITHADNANGGDRGDKEGGKTAMTTRATEEHLDRNNVGIEITILNTDAAAVLTLAASSLQHTAMDTRARTVSRNGEKDAEEAVMDWSSTCVCRHRRCRHCFPCYHHCRLDRGVEREEIYNWRECLIEDGKCIRAKFGGW